MNATSDNATLLRRALRGNAAFSTASGLAFVAASGPIAATIGLEQPIVLIAIGLGLLVFAAGLIRNAARANVNRIEARLAVAGDLAWVLGSGVVIALGILTRTGNWAAAIVADVVLLFAILQLVGLRRLARS